MDPLGGGRRRTGSSSQSLAPTEKDIEGMTNSPDLPVRLHGSVSAQTGSDRPVRGVWSVVDAVVSSLLACGVAVADVSIGFLFLVGWTMSSDGCSPGGPCPEQHAANQAMLVAIVGLLISVVVAIGGLLVSARKNVLMIWAPIAGALITFLVWSIVTSMA